MLYRGRIILGVLLAGCATAAPEPGQEPAQEPARAQADTAQADTTQVAPPQAGPPSSDSRPIPYAIEPPPDFEAAIERGTRTTTGRPGPRYWQNTASYTLEARLGAAQKRLEGSGRIVYYNQSPDTLENLHLDLTQNFHAEGAIRTEAAEITGGVDIASLVADGRALTTEGGGPRYAVFGTRLVILPPSPVEPGDSAVLEITWAFDVPQAGAGERMGYAGDDLFFLGYWYPQMAVYDDVVGWHPDPFLGTTEFYADFARYDVTIDAPAGWIVMSTGELQNADEVLTSETRERLSFAESSDTVITVVTAAGAANATQDGTDGRLRWRFVADSVRDVAFSATRSSNWDAQRTPVGDLDGDGAADYTRVDAFYRETAPFWRSAARYAAHAIDFLSRFTDIAYPWPHMSAVEAGEIIGGGMEFPMMTLIGDYNARGDSALYYVVAHELAHMWVPMIVSSDERRYSWLDEGTTTFHENQARNEFYPGVNHEEADQESYIELALSGDEGEIMRRSAYHYNPAAYGIASYPKPASVLVALRGVLGEGTFMRGYHAFLQRWKYKHPYPWDLWNTFEDVAGRDLDWFWRSWYYETWTLDQAVGSVTAGADGTRIVIDDLGLVPMPVHLAITLEDGEVLRREIPVDSWLSGGREAVLALQTPSPVARVEIDPEHAFPDVNRDNNVWTRR